MIPADLASRLRLVAQDLPTPAQPVQPARQLTDVLSDLSSGQKILAEIQAQLPNGAYRAIIAQNEITLALPFSAKAGDTLELEVVESEGKLSLAFIGKKTAAEENPAGESAVPTRLSKAGNLIGDLLGSIDHDGGKARPAVLNGNQPILTSFPERPADMAPLLKDALVKSGVFYEAHQARWVEGKLGTDALRQEPQGKLPPLIVPPPGTPANPQVQAADPAAEIAAHVHLSDSARQKIQADPEIEIQPQHTSQAPPQSSKSELPEPEQAVIHTASNTLSKSSEIALPASTQIHPQSSPIVQQQLNALATQTYVWQGQIWPGQTMDWEITQDDGRPRTGEEQTPESWLTRLRLDLPNLGTIETRIGLDRTGKLSFSLCTAEESSQKTLSIEATKLQQSLNASGLQLKHFSVTHGEIPR